MGSTGNKNLSEKAYAFICDRLAGGELKPGDKLSEPSLAAACGVSRTPMREAVRRLVEEGILYQKEKSGTYISGFSAKDLADAYAIRLAIESAMLTIAVPRLTRKDITTLQRHCNRMRAAIETMRRHGMTELAGRPEAQFLADDLAFHLLFLRISGNALAEKIIANAYRRNQFFGTHSHLRTLKNTSMAWRYHCEILKACRQRDTAKAVDWLKAHLKHSEETALLPVSTLLGRLADDH